MKLTAEQLHERGPPLSDADRQLLSKEAKVFGITGLALMTATAIDYCAVALDHAPTRSEMLIHGGFEVAGIFAVAGIAAEFARAATSKTAAFEDLRNTVFGNAKKFGFAAIFMLGVGGANAFVETGRRDNDALAHSPAAASLPKMSCDKQLYASTPTTPRHFAQGRDVFVFQHHLVKCDTPAPKGFQELSSPIPVTLVPKPSTY